MHTALLNSAKIAIFQGSPLGRPFGQFVERARVTMLGLVPSIAKVWQGSAGRGVHAVGVGSMAQLASAAMGSTSAPATVLQGWRATDCMKGLDWSCLRCYRYAQLAALALAEARNPACLLCLHCWRC